MSANFSSDICDTAETNNLKTDITNSANHNSDNNHNYNNCNEHFNTDFQNFPQSYSFNIHSEHAPVNNSAGTSSGLNSYQQQQILYANDQKNQQLQKLQQYLNFKNLQDSHNFPNELINHQDQIPSSDNLANNAYYENQYSNSAKRPHKRELGIVEKLVGSYGFVKCLDREIRLFFHYSSFQAEQHASNNDNSLKVNDLIEFEEGIDKRNGKPVAINITRFQQNSQQPDNLKQNLQQQLSMEQLNMFNLNTFLKKSDQKQQQRPTDNTEGSFNNTSNYYATNKNNTDQQNFQTIINGLKMLNNQSLKDNESLPIVLSENGLNPAVRSLFNKENIFKNTKNNLNQLNLNNNLLNMIKSQATSIGCNGNGSSNIQNSNVSIDNLSNLAKILSQNGPVDNTSNEKIEGTIAIVATKKPSHYNNRNQPFIAPQLDGRITYQRSGETFYIQYSLCDVLSSSSSMPVYPQVAVQLKVGDRVRFFIAQALGNELNVPIGTFYARQVELVNAGSENEMQMPQRRFYRGIITTLKESFGKIEREEQLKETFFHFHEYIGQNPTQELKLGLNVEFELQDRYGKEIACNIKMLPAGTVCFDELSKEVYIGRITQPLTKVSSLLQNTNLNGIKLNDISSIGKLVFDNTNNNENGSLTELVFSNLDRHTNAGEYTLLEGDFVQFRIASDKRQRSYSNNTQLSQKQRATQVTLIEEYSLADNFSNTGEYRERGVLVKIGLGRELVQNIEAQNPVSHQRYGVIKCLEKNELIYFLTSEVINYVKFVTNGDMVTPTVKASELKVGDSLEFCIVNCSKDALFKNGLRAIRVQKLPEGTVKLEEVSKETYMGFIEADLAAPTNKNSSLEKHYGMIKLETAVKLNSSYLIKTLPFDQSKCERIKSGDKVQFNIFTCLKTKKNMAVNIKVVEIENDQIQQGIITMLKEDYGFIELIPRCYQIKANHKEQQFFPQPDIFFKISSVKNLTSDLEVGDEVEFKINQKGDGDQNIFAEFISRLKSGTIKFLNVSSSTVYRGRIVQQLKHHSVKESQTVHSYGHGVYYGKVLVTSPKKDNESVYEFGIFGLGDRKKIFQVGEMVTFQLVNSAQDGSKKAVNLQLQNSQGNGNNTDVKKGKIDSIKGHCGYIEYSVNGSNDTKKVFFHVSDLTEGSGGKSESSGVQIGDEVEFILTHSSRSGKVSAIKIKKLANKGSNPLLHTVSSNGKDLNELDQQPAVVAKRPEHLITKLKVDNVCNINGKKLYLIRQPTKPDGKSFVRHLFRREPGTFESLDPPVVNGLGSDSDTEKQQSNEGTINESNTSHLSIMDLLIANNKDLN